MRLHFTKDVHKLCVLKCIRSDGSETWRKTTLPFMLEHDLVHYAVETTLNFHQAFYGLLRQGYNITDFEAPRHLRPAALLPANLPLEAKQTEMLVSLLQTEIHDSTDIEDFISIAQLTFQAQGIAFPAITKEQIGQVRHKIWQLLNQWNQIPLGETLQLQFSVSENAHQQD